MATDIHAMKERATRDRERERRELMMAMQGGEDDHSFHSAHQEDTEDEVDVTTDPLAHIKAKFKLPFFGMPVEDKSPEALLYAGRKQLSKKKKKKGQDPDSDDEREEERRRQEEAALRAAAAAAASSSSTDLPKNSVAQKKVAHALQIMASNGTTTHHFIHDGGIEAVYRMISESDDEDVLGICSACLVEVTDKGVKHAPALLEKSIVSNVTTLIEVGSEYVKFMAARTLSNLSRMEGISNKLVRAGVVTAAMALIASTREDTVSYAALTICNVATDIATGPDAEQAARTCTHVAKRLDLMNDVDAAKFASMLFNNLARVPVYSALLVEEGVIPMLIGMLMGLNEVPIIEACVETFVNLSMNRKNQREISSSGVSNALSKILGLRESPLSRAYTLLMVGNLLSSGYLHDKIARKDVIDAILSMLDPRDPKQFVAVAFCVCQICLTEVSAELVVQCGVIPLTISLLDAVQSAEERDGTATASTGTGVRDGVKYLWTLLINLTVVDDNVRAMCKGDVGQSLVEHIDRECTSMLPYEEDITHNGPVNRKDVTLQFLLNLTTRDFFQELFTDEQMMLLAAGLRELLREGREVIRVTVLTVIINIAVKAVVTRPVFMGENLVALINELGITDPEVNNLYVQLLSLISEEEECSIRLLDSNTQMLVVSLQSSVTDRGRDLSAAILHNLSFRRAAMCTGMLSTLMNLVRGCKTIRTLWVVRCIANLSSTIKTRTALAKERRLVSLLTVLMRGGGAEAERVQHYCAYAVCNILSTFMDKTILEELLKNGTVGDLVVVTLLRVNSKVTKASLAKALFNLLARGDFRSRMVDIGILEALVELGKIELVELLDLHARSIYNISCECATVPEYAAKFGAIGIPSLLIGRITSSKSLHGCVPTNGVKTMCGMAMANISFCSQLANDLVCDINLPNAFRVLTDLITEEASYCVAITTFNMSFLANVTRLASTSTITNLVAVVQRGPVLCTQLCIGALVNMSQHAPFHDQLSTECMSAITTVMSTPTIAFPIKLDCLQFIYNVTTQHQPARPIAIEADVIPALWRMVKTQSDNDIILMIGRIIKELCTEAPTHLKKLLQDGIMSVLLKMAKIEVAPLKVDLAMGMFALTIPHSADTMRLLKYDGVDVLFWLTLHDCLKLYDFIKLNAAKALLNFSSTKEEALVLCKEDRFITIMKELARSADQAVLWTSASIIFNLMGIDECKAIMIDRGVIALLFDIAACNIPAVQHVCSACLHMAPDDMPDMDDPAVLHLVMCLLDADGEMFGDLNKRAIDMPPYKDGVNTWAGTVHSVEGTDFTGHWVSLTCDVDKIFLAAKVPLAVLGFSTLKIQPLAASSLEFPKHELLEPKSFNDFKPNLRVVEPAPDAAAAASAGPATLDNAPAISGNGGMFTSPMSAARLSINEGRPDSAASEFDEGFLEPGNSIALAAVGVPELTPAAPDTSDSTAGFGASTHVVPEDVNSIAFPRIQNMSNRTPDDTLGAIKTSLYKPAQKFGKTKAQYGATV